jgi:predicted metal-dependent phosphoesterase TrpH
VTWGGQTVHVLGLGIDPGHVAHQWASLAQAVGWIAASGGIAVLAHPGRYPMNDAQRYGLLASAGSDFHGTEESRRDLGDLPALPDGCAPVWAQF